MVLSSDGASTFQGHLHDSGFPSFDYLVVLTIKGTDSIAYACSQGGHLHGTDEPGSRDDSWDQTVMNDQVRENWPAIRGGQPGHSVSITSDFSPKAIFDEIVATVGTVLGIVGIIIAAAVGGSSYQDPNAPNGPSGPGILNESYLVVKAPPFQDGISRQPLVATLPTADRWRVVPESEKRENT